MSNSSFDQQRPLERSEYSEKSQPAPSDAIRDTGFFARVLAETLQQSSQLESADAEELNVIRNAVQSYLGEPFAFEPIVVAMIEGLLSVQFPVQANDSEHWKGICSRIAKTLYDDPASRTQLEDLWTHLSKAPQ